MDSSSPKNEPSFRQPNESKLMEQQIPLFQMNNAMECNSSCEKMHSGILKMKAWVATQRSIWNSFEMLSEIRNSKTNQYHNNLHQFQQISNLVDGFASDLRNMFDNYVCFYGSEDKIHLINFIESAHSRALVNFGSQEFARCVVLKEFVLQCCNKLEQICTSDNDKIIENELGLGIKLKIRLLQEVQHIFEQNQTGKSPAELKLVISNLQQGVLMILSRCLDNNGKLSYVQTEFSQKLLEELGLILQIFNCKGGLNKETSLIKAATNFYYSKSLEKELYKYPVNFSEDEIRSHHKIHLDKACSLLEHKEDINDLKSVLESHLIHILYKRNEQNQTKSHENLPAMKQNQNDTLCIYLTLTHCRIDSFSSNDITPILYPPAKDSWFPAVMAFHDGEILFGKQAKSIIDKSSSKNEKAAGKIDDYIRGCDPDINNTEALIKKLFEQFKLTAQTCLKKYFSRVIFLVPCWYNEKDHKKLYHLSKEAGFKETQVLDETSVIAYKILEEARHDKKDSEGLAVLFAVGPDNVISVKIFGLKKESVCVCILLGASFINQVGVLECKDIRKAYNKALLQVDQNRREVKKYCCVLSDSKNMQCVFEEFFASLDFSRVADSPRYTYGVRGAALLTFAPYKPSNLILNFLYAEESTTQVISNTRDDGDSFVENHKSDKSLENDGILNNKRKQLLQKCRYLKEQMQQKKVKVGRLFVKDVLEVLDKAEQVASNEYAFSDEIEFEESEIAELVLEYGFNDRLSEYV